MKQFFKSIWEFMMVMGEDRYKNYKRNPYGHWY